MDSGRQPCGLLIINPQFCFRFFLCISHLLPHGDCSLNFELVGARNDPVRNGIRHGTATQLVTAEIGQLGAEGNRSHREITVCAVLCQEVPIHHRWALNITPFGSHPIRGPEPPWWPW